MDEPSSRVIKDISALLERPVMELRKDVLAGRAAFEFDLFGDDLDRNVSRISEIMEWADRTGVDVRYAISESGVDEDETAEIVMNVLREQLAQMRKVGFYLA